VTVPIYYVVFIERALELLDPTGLLGFITPHKYWQAKYGQGLRSIIANGKHLGSVIDFADQQVFRGATNYTAIQSFGKSPNTGAVDYARITHLHDGEAQCRAIDGRKGQDGLEVFQALRPEADEPWVFTNARFDAWLSSVAADHRTLGEITSKIAQGLVSGCDDVFYVERDRGRWQSRATGRAHAIETLLLHPLLKGSVHVRRWVPDRSSLAVVFPYKCVARRWSLISPDEMSERFPRTYAYFQGCRARLENRERGRFAGEEFYQFSRPQNFDVMPTPKVLVPSIATRGEYCVDDQGKLFFVGSGGGGGGGYAIVPSVDIDLYFLCGLLNSRCLDTFLKQVTTRFHSGWYAYSNAYLSRLPIKLPESASERSDAERISERVRQIIGAKEKLQTTALGQNERERLERQVEAHEAAIDQLVYKLYGLGDDDIRVVEESNHT